MRTRMAVLGLVAAVWLLQVAEVQAGAAAGDLYTSFTGPAFNATVILNPDPTEPSSCAVEGAACPSQGTVSLRLSKGNQSSGVIFVSGPVSQFGLGCDAALTDGRFLGRPWIPTPIVAALLAPFGMIPDDAHPLVFSDISNPVCTPVPNAPSDAYQILSFTGTMQFGKKLQQ
jgi:hypothetical protein